MNRLVLVVAALAVLGSGCSKEEEEQASAPESEQPAMSTPERVEAAAGEAVDEAADVAEEVGSSAEQTAEEVMAAAEEKAAEAEAAVDETATEVQESASETMEQAAAAVAPENDGRGKEIYDTACFACHATGAAGAPKMGDKAAWEPRIAQGMELLYDHSINGIRAMPPKGGYMHLADEEVKQAVDYMVSQSQ